AVHDYKGTYKLLKNRGLELAGVVDDTMITAYLIQPDRRSHDLPDIAQVHLKMSLDTTEAPANGQLALDLEGPDLATPAVRAAHVVRELSLHLAGMLVERGGDALLKELEMPLSHVLAQMEMAGIAIDTAKL